VETVSHRTMPERSRGRSSNCNIPSHAGWHERRLRCVVRWESRYSWRCHVSLSMPRSRQTRRAAGWSSARAWSVTPRRKLYDLLVFAKREWTLLSEEGMDVADALQTVNNRSRGSKVCDVTLVALTDSMPIAERVFQGRLASIVQIMVQAVGDGVSWRTIPTHARYIVEVEEGQII
jgi:hypothetical protein